MKRLDSRWDLDEVEASASAEDAALRVVERLTKDKDDVTAEWVTALWLAQANGASLRDIAKVAGVSPQTVANLCDRHQPKRGS
jgi:hypothetical protein